jgi:hypothetical protein
LSSGHTKLRSNSNVEHQHKMFNTHLINLQNQLEPTIIFEKKSKIFKNLGLLINQVLNNNYRKVFLNSIFGVKNTFSTLK